MAKRRTPTRETKREIRDRQGSDTLAQLWSEHASEGLGIAQDEARLKERKEAHKRKKLHLENLERIEAERAVADDESTPRIRVAKEGENHAQNASE